MKIVRVNIDGTMNDVDITLKKKNILKVLEENSSSKGSTNFAELYKWNHEGKEVICYGWYDGEAGFENKHDLPEGIPHIIVANHQSPYDIPPIIWYLRKIHPKFISKKELGRGIPSVSYNLRKGGSILIDRKNPRQSLPEIKKFAQYLNNTNRSAVIFPEGTRSKTGMPRKFSPNGLKMLFKFCPKAVIVPVTINNSWKIFYYTICLHNMVAIY